MAPIPPVISWDDKPQTNVEDSNLPEKFYQLKYNGHALMFTVDVYGKEALSDIKGCPMWICLHGGGTTNTDKDDYNNNDDNWRDGRSYFASMVKPYAANHGPVIMVCPRGVSTRERETKSNGEKVLAWDDYNLHFRDESYVLIEQMIIRLLQPKAIEAPYFVDPNRVFLWGFSAGGDGAFNMAARIPDRFAGVVAGAGHPNGATFANCANLELLLQVGERDVLLGMGGRRISRAKVYLEDARAQFIHLTQKHGGNGTLYKFNCMVVQTLTAKANSSYFYHNGWSSDNTGTILKSTPRDDATVTAWLGQPDLQGEKFNKWLEAQDWDRVWTSKQPDGWYASNITINPLLVFKDTNEHMYKRNPTPSRVIWDLNMRPPRPHLSGNPDAAPQGWEKRMLYWLYVRQSPLDAEAVALVNQGVEDASHYYGTTPSAHIIHVARPNQHMGYLLKESWITGGQTITLRINTGGTTKDYALGTVAIQPSIKAQTMALSGDPELEFAAMVYLTSKDGTWNAVIAKSLDG